MAATAVKRNPEQVKPPECLLLNGGQERNRTTNLSSVNAHTSSRPACIAFVNRFLAAFTCAYQSAFASKCSKARSHAACASTIWSGGTSTSVPTVSLGFRLVMSQIVRPNTAKTSSTASYVLNVLSQSLDPLNSRPLAEWRRSNPVGPEEMNVCSW